MKPSWPHPLIAREGWPYVTGTLVCALLIHALLGLASPRSAETGYSREIPRELLSIYLDFLAGLLYGHLSEERIVEFSRSCSTYLQFRWMHRALRLAFMLDTPLLIH